MRLRVAFCCPVHAALHVPVRPVHTCAMEHALCLDAGEGKMYAPGNLRATTDNPQYEKLLNYYVQEKYTLR